MEKQKLEVLNVLCVEAEVLGFCSLLAFFIINDLHFTMVVLGIGGFAAIVRYLISDEIKIKKANPVVAVAGGMLIFIACLMV